MFYPRSVDIIKIVLHLWMKGSPFQQQARRGGDCERCREYDAVASHWCNNEDGVFQ